MALKEGPAILTGLCSFTEPWRGCLCLHALPFTSLGVFYVLEEFGKVGLICCHKVSGTLDLLQQSFWFECHVMGVRA